MMIMENLIDEITERLQLVNKMMVSKCVPDEVTFTDALVLVQFFHDFQHTNLLIDAAESLAKGGVQNLMESVAKLRMPSLSLFLWTSRCGDKWIIFVWKKSIWLPTVKSGIRQRMLQQSYGSSSSRRAIGWI